MSQSCSYNIQVEMSELTRRELDTGEQVFFSVVQKQSQKGFSMNRRLLLMVDDKFICYLSNPKTDFPLTSDYISKNAKMLVPLKQLMKITSKQTDKSISIEFWMPENNRRLIKTWILEMGSVSLLDSWQQLFDDYSVRSRNNTLEIKSSKRSKSKENIKDLSPTRFYNNLEGQRMNEKPSIVESARGNNLIEQSPINTKPFQNYPGNSSESVFENANFVSPSPLKQFPESSVKMGQIKKDRFVSHQPLQQFPESPLKMGQIKKDMFVSHQPLQKFPESSLNMGEGKSNRINIQPSIIQDRSSYFKDYNVGNNSVQSVVKKGMFTNYYRPYLDEILNLDSNYMKESKLNEINTKYTKFIEYSKQNVIALVDSKLDRIRQQQRQKGISQHIKDDMANWIRFQELYDITIELGLIQLKNVKNDNFICDDALNKMASNNFKNLQFLYDIIRRDNVLMCTFYVPMVCVVQYKGYTCFVSSKIMPMEDQEYEASVIETTKQTSKDFDRLSNLSRIGFEIFQNEKLIKFLPRNARKDKFAICFAKTYLPQLQDSLILRKESFSAIFLHSQKENYRYQGSKKEMDGQSAKISSYLQTQIIGLSDMMNKLEIYPISPSELSEILHMFGINTKHLSLLYSKISQNYLQGIIKTEVAVRVFRTIFKKKLQENLGRSKGRFINEEAGRELLNILLGDREETSDLWKVVSLHTQIYFNLSVDRADINRGYLLLGLSNRLSIEIFNAYTSIDNIFKVNNFVQGIKFHPKVKHPDMMPLFIKQMTDDYQIHLSEPFFNKMVQSFQLDHNPFPAFLTCHTYLFSKILYLFSYFVSPNDKNYSHLRLYDSTTSQYAKMQQFSLYYLQRKLLEIKWEIRSEARREHVLMLLGKLRETVQNYYGKYHPFISEIYQLQSLYYLQICEQESAININKESLSNMIQCCGNNNRHLKISNNYYQLGEVYKKCNRFDEALQNYKKAKNILEINSHQNFPEYAHILYKLGKMHLLQNRDIQSYDLFLHAIKLYESIDVFAHWEQLVELYEAIFRCNFKLVPFNKMPSALQDIRLAEHCVTQLEKVLGVELQLQLCSDEQFVRVLKIVVEQYFAKIKKEDRSLMRNYVLEVCDSFTTSLEENAPTYSESIVFFKTLILDGTFLQKLQSYISETKQILSRLKNDKKIGRLIPHRRNELIQSYDMFMKHMIAIIGESFLLSTIK